MSTLVSPVRPEDLKYFNGKELATLNPTLVARQRSALEDVRDIQFSHRVKRRIFTMMENAKVEDLPKLARLVGALEFKQQSLWGFEPEASRHYWWKVPRCSCSVDLNRACYGQNQFRVVKRSCIVHGPMLAANGSDEVKPRPFSVPRGHVIIDIGRIERRFVLEQVIETFEDIRASFGLSLGNDVPDKAIDEDDRQEEEPETVFDFEGDGLGETV